MKTNHIHAKEPIDKQAVLNSFGQFLKQTRYADQTIERYLYQLKVFLSAYPCADAFRYKDVVEALSTILGHITNAHYRVVVLAAVKKYYDYLIDTGFREDHPCRKLQFRCFRKTKIIAQDLFSPYELELLLDREERYANLKMRNQALVSLLIYQGLTSGEITRLQVHHVDLEEGKIQVKQSKKLAARFLNMTATQRLILERYLEVERKNLLKGSSDAFIIGKEGRPISCCEVAHVLEQFKLLFPGRRLSPLTVRQSVISNWLNKQNVPLETVQLMAGHKWISSTLRYESAFPENQRDLINKFHPLG